jgi:hypothetical protein
MTRSPASVGHASRLVQLVSNLHDGDFSLTKIFQIGFNRCGTTTLFKFFQKNNIPSIHWDGGRLAKRFLERKKRNEDPFLDYQNITFFSDMIYLSSDEIIEPYRDFEYIHKYYPDSYYILNTRPFGKWVKSRLGHSDFAKRYQSVFNLKSLDDVIQHWRLAWYEQHHRILKYFEQFPRQMLYFDIELDGPQQIVQFLNNEFKLDPSLYGHENRAVAHQVRWRM